MKMVNNLIEPLDVNLSSGLLIWTWIIFFHSSDDGYIQILSDQYIRILAQKLRNCKHSINVLTIALSPECCGSWQNAIHALNTFMEVYVEQRMNFPMDY